MVATVGVRRAIVAEIFQAPMIKTAVALLLVGCTASCDRVTEPDRGIKQEPDIRILSPMSADHPRQSEGDIEVLRDGRLLAAYVDFYGGTGDASAAQISARLSSDRGLTWSEPFPLVEREGEQNVGAASLLRLADGRLMLGYLRKNSATDLHPYVRVSLSVEDLAFGVATRITDEPGYYVWANDRLVQLSTGRILAPLSYTPDLINDNHFRVVVYYSDDLGRTWLRGPGVLDLEKRGAMEPATVELSDGRVLIIMRSQLGQIMSAISEDGAETFGPVRSLGVAAPEAPSSIARIPDGRLLLIYNPTAIPDADHLGPRTPLRSAVSLDDGMTWERFKDLETDPETNFAYPSVTFVGEMAFLTYSSAPDLRGVSDLKIAIVPVSWF